MLARGRQGYRKQFTDKDTKTSQGAKRPGIDTGKETRTQTLGQGDMKHVRQTKLNFVPK